MHRRVSLVFSTLFVLFVSALGLPMAGVAQVAFVAPQVAEGQPRDDVPDSARVLERGQSLEGERRWGEALTHYEDALRRYPRDAALEQRLDLCRIHYELGRRYSDSSFKRSLATMSEREALDLYAEVLLKIQSHYVDAPQWKQLVDHSTGAYQVALADPVFVEHNLPRLSQAQIDRFRREVNERVAAWQIANRHVARDAVAYIARLGRERLGLSSTVSILEYTCAATTGLDPYSTFLTADQLNEVYSQIEGNFVGLGIELKASEGSLLIVKAIAGSPAEKAGIRAGDRIVAVDGRSTQDLSTDQAANLLQGKEGTYVEVGVLSPNGATRPLRVRREQVDVPSVDGGRIVDADLGIAYLRLTCFQKTTARDLDRELWRLHSLGMKSLILDLRGNPGGLLAVSVEVVDKFVDTGLIVSTKGRGPQEDYRYNAQSPGTWRMPLVVLIDGESASASEIFAGAIRDHRRGVIVGSRSYGKGSVQGIFPLNLAGSGLRLTTAKFYSPLNQPYSGVGVEPDVKVGAAHTAAKPLVNEAGDVVGLPPTEQQPDAVLDAAVQTAKNQLAKR
ncbi:MAG: S41 family peptidase [Planctomycetia bacterium]|nr:S41 family peptidase [Planctomycetia bacterium]